MKDVVSILRRAGLYTEEVSQAADLLGDTDDLWRSLIAQGLVTEQAFFEAVASYNNVEYVDITGVSPSPETLSKLSSDFCRRNSVIPIGHRDNFLFLAISDPNALRIIDDASALTGMDIAPKIVIPTAIQSAIDRFMRSDEELDKLSGELQGEDGSGELESDSDELTGRDDDAPVVRFVNLLISQAVQDRASDIHVEPGEKYLRVRFRIDGVLHEMQKADRSIQAGVISRLKIMADIDIAEKRKPQDGRMSVRHNGSKIDIRVAALPTVWGEKMVMRILDHSTDRRDLDSMDLSTRDIAVFRNATRQPHGMILVTGPTGSGKALRLDTPIPTPTGMTTMGELKVGDEVLDARMNPTKVTALSDINTRPNLYKLSLSDGQEIFADGDHQWIVATHESRNHARRKKSISIHENQMNGLAAADTLATLATLYDDGEFITPPAMMAVLEENDLTKYIVSRSALMAALRYRDVPLDYANVHGRAYRVFKARYGMEQLAERLRERFSNYKDRPVLLTLSTDEILAEGLELHGRANFSIPVVSSSESVAEDTDLIIDPYVLGVWLGDGNSSGGAIASGYEDYEEMHTHLSNAWRGTIKIQKDAGAVCLTLRRPEPEKCILGHEYVEGKNYCVKHNEHYGVQKDPVNGSLGELLARSGLRNNKHIPVEYMRASYSQRLALLQGIMDSDGSASKNGRGMGFGFSNLDLARQGLELVRSLGIKATLTKKKAGYKNNEGVFVPCKDSYSIQFTTSLPVFRLARKLERVKDTVGESQKWLYIKSIEPVYPTDPEYGAVRCISVDSSDHSYLCADSVVTHNSTTLYTTLSEVSNDSINVITVEDPVEKKIEGVNQIQINKKADMTFSAALRSILRADPDVVLIGEIRDSETAQIATEASLTGHLVLSTLHTNGAPEAITRIVEMGVEPYLAGTAISCVMAQRLARRLCSKCKVPIEIDPEVLKELHFDHPEAVFYGPKGCSECSETGFRGRVAVVEIMEINEDIERLAVSRAPSSEIRKAATANGMTSLRQDGFRRVSQGLTTLEEIIRVTA